MKARSQKDVSVPASGPAGGRRPGLARSAAVVGLLLACTGCVIVPPVEPVPMPVSAGSGGTVTPQCREYSQVVTIGGERRQAYGTTCRQSDGTWRIAGANAASPPSPSAVYAPAPAYRGPAVPYIVIPVGPATEGDLDRK